MTELYIFSQDDKPLTIVTEEAGLVSAPVRIEVNSVPDTPFSFTVEADTDVAEYVKEENKVVYRDHEGDLRLVVIKELDDSDSINGPETTAICEPEFMELAETFVLDRRFTDKTAQEALDAALLNTGYVGEVEVELGLASTNFYRLPVVDAVFDIISTWGGEFKDIVEFDTNNNIIARKIKILQRLGADTGQRFEIDHNITEIGRTVLSYPKTAMYGWGASLETDDGGNTRYIDFGDVVWSKANGDPVDKPKGQMWVGDPEAFENYKRYRDGAWRHRFGEFSNQEYDDPEELLWATWQNLQANKYPVVNYRLSVDLFDDKVSLGDTAIAIDRIFARPIEIQSRIIAMEYDLLDIEGTMTVEMGQHLNLDDDRLDDLERDVEKLKSTRPSAQVTENSYLDIKPGTPVNVQAIGSYYDIQLYWDYTSEIYLEHYEVYGSQVADFIPDTQHLLWRGKMSAFAHNVTTDETWYYYVRAVNYQGTPSDWSVKVEASTVRIISDDILFGSIKADHLADNLDLANKLSDGTLDWINNEPLYQIQEMNTRLLGQIDNKLEIIDYQNAMIDVNTELNNINLSVVDVQGKYDDAVARITAIDLKSDSISLSVSELTTDFNNLEIGGRNLISVEGFQVVNHLLANTSNRGEMIDNETFKIYANPPNGLAFLFKATKVEHGQEYTLNADMSDTISSLMGVAVYDKSGNILEEAGLLSGDFNWVPTYRGYQLHSDGVLATPYIFKIEDERVGYVRARLGIYRGNFITRDVLIKKPKLEKGNKATDWSPAPEDMADKAQLISYINLSSEGIRIHGERVHISGQTLIDDAVIGTAAIADASISRVKLGTAVVGTAQIDDLAVSSAKIAKLSVDDSHIANLSVTKLLAGEIDTDKFTVRGGSAIDYTLIQGSSLTARGQFTRTWRGSTQTHDVTLRMYKGYLRAENPSRDRAVSFSDFGISTFADGDGGGSSSGTIEFFSRRFSSVNGLTMYSTGTYGVDADEIISQSRYGQTIESNESQLYFRPNRTNRPGNNTFQLSVLSESQEHLTDGFLAYGSTATGYASGLRFSKRAAEPIVWVVNGDLARYSDTKIGAGYFMGYMAMSHTGSNFYIGSSSETRSVNSTAYQNGNINYIPHRADSFPTGSSEIFKTDIKKYEESALEQFRKSVIYEYTRKASGVRELGFIIEREMPEIVKFDEESVNGYTHRSLNTLGIKELDLELTSVKDELKWLKTENQILKNEIEILKEKVE